MFDIRTSATDYPILVSMDIKADDVVGQVFEFSYGLGIPASIGTARESGIKWIADDTTSPLPNVTIGTDWLVFPTLPAKYYRRIITQSPIRTIIRFNSGIKMAPSSSLAFVFVSGASLSSITRQLTVNLVIDS